MFPCVFVKVQWLGCQLIAIIHNARMKDQLASEHYYVATNNDAYAIHTFKVGRPS